MPLKKFLLAILRFPFAERELQRILKDEYKILLKEISYNFMITSIQNIVRFVRC